VEQHGQKTYNEVGRSFFCGNEVSVSSYSEVRNTNQLCFGAETLLFADISARCLRSKVTLPGFDFFWCWWHVTTPSCQTLILDP
jgi:hypothetical protein